MSARTDAAERLIRAAPQAIYDAHVIADSLAAWRRPEGMHARVEQFDPRPGGRYRMALIYDDPSSAAGKTSATEDVFEGEFIMLDPPRRIVEEIVFESDDPSFAGRMRLTTTIKSRDNGALVRIEASNVPSGITAEDHAAGLASSLANLAAFVEDATLPSR